MNLIYIENKQLLTKIITYLDYKNIDYTININDDFNTLIVAQVNTKTYELVKKAKRIIYIAYLDEEKIYNNFNKSNKNSLCYQNKMNDFFKKCSMVIVSIPYMKKIIECKKIIIIPLENMCIGYCKNKIFNLKKRVITIIDSNYKYLTTYLELIANHNNLNFELIGFNTNISKKEELLLNDLPKNLSLIKFCNDRILENYIVNSSLIIYFDNILENRNYINICQMKKLNILLLKNNLTYDYLIDNKNIYLFEIDSLEKKFNKIVSNRVANLGNESYDLIKDNEFKEIADKFCKLLK